MYVSVEHFLQKSKMVRKGETNFLCCVNIFCGFDFLRWKVLLSTKELGHWPKAWVCCLRFCILFFFSDLPGPPVWVMRTLGTSSFRISTTYPRQLQKRWKHLQPFLVVSDLDSRCETTFFDLSQQEVENNFTWKYCFAVPNRNQNDRKWSLMFSYSPENKIIRKKNI